MRESLLSKTNHQLPGNGRRCALIGLLIFVISLLKFSPLLAEGSKDFVSYPGYRMFLDTRDPQQLKVFAKAGEYINVGASHVGVQGGFIKVYSPDTSLVFTYDGTGPNANLAKINSWIQELNGPTGGGTTMGTGYVPGAIQVPPGQEGVWTVIFDYPEYVNTSFVNLLNNFQWTAINQPNSRRVVLAWDVTVTSGGAGNNGGMMHEGRLYSNEHISLINGNGFSTSPTFFVLTQDGYLYEVNIDRADPFRFPISSNSLGLVNGLENPIYKSKDEVSFERNDDPGSWTQDTASLYLFEPQAQDVGPLINNKIFFNLPDTTMPDSALVTDIFRKNVHFTWLYKERQDFLLTNFLFEGANTGGPPCSPGAISFGKGGWFILETNLGGSVTLQLDLNGNGVFSDPIDVTIVGTLNEGRDSIFWDGKDGFGNQVPLQEDFAINYQGKIRYGEIHIALTDVENNEGGVKFKWLNPTVGAADSLFYYNHTDVGGPISVPLNGTLIPGVPQATTVPYTYMNNAGNDKYLDQWSFVEFNIDSNTIIFDVVIDCVCQNGTPSVTAVSDPGDVCAGEDLVLSATNSTTGIGNLTYNWTGPNSYQFTDTVGVLDTSFAIISPATEINEGSYRVIVSTPSGCADTLDYSVIVNPLPVASAITGGGAVCAGQNVTLSSMNTTAGIAQVNYVWTGPNGFTESGTVAGSAMITVTLSAVTAANAGTYTLALTSGDGCVAAEVSTTVSVTASPVLSAVSNPGAVCAGQSLILSATNSLTGLGNLTYNWTGPNNFTFSETIGELATSVATINQVTAAGSGTYTVVASTAGGCSSTLSFSVSVNPVPVASAITGGGAFCVGADVTLSSMNTTPGISQISYLWTGPNGFNETGTVSGTDVISVLLSDITPAGSGTYTLTLTSAEGCTSASATANVTVSVTPVLTAVSGGGSYCEDQNVTLTASNTAAGVNTMICVWTGPNNLSVTQNLNGGDPIVLNLTNVNNSFEGTYSVVCTTNGCASNSLPFNVIIDRIPEINVISPNGNFCVGSLVNLTGSNVVAGTGPITYTWTGPNPNNPLFPFTATTALELGPFPVSISSFTAADAGTYCLVLETAGGCQSTEQCVTIGVAATPNIINLMGAGDACAGQNVLLSASNNTPGVAPVIFTWSGPNGIIIAGVGGNNGPFTATINNISPADAGIYTLSLVSDLTSCVADTSFTINVFPGLNIEDVSPDSVYCEGADVVLTASNTVAAGDLTYQWTGPNNVVYGPFTVGSFEPLTATIPGIMLNQAGAYTLTVTSAIGCTTDPITVNIGVNPNVEIITVTGGGQYCVGDDVPLNGTGQGSATSVTYTWTDPNGDVVGTGTTGAAGPFPANVANPMSGTYNLVVTTDQGCGDSASVTIDFNLQPVAFVLNNDTILCNLDTLSLCGQNLTPGIGVFDYVWTTPNGELIQGSASGNDVFCDEILPLVTFGEGIYTLVISSNGCISEPDSFTLTLNPNPVISLITGGGTYCEGEPVELCFSNTNPEVDSFFYTCILPDGTQTTGIGSGTDQVCLPPITIPGFVCCSLESFDGCVSSLICTEIIYQPAPDITASADPSVLCEGDSLTLSGANNATGTGNVDYTWLDPTGAVLFTGTAPWGGPFPASDPDPQSGDYCLIVSSGNNCSDTTCVNVTVNPVPVVVNNSISGGGEFCEGEMTELSATVTISDGSDITYTWTLDGNVIETGTVPSGTVLTLDLGTLGLNDGGEYCLELVSDQGCAADAVCTTVTVNPTPAISTVTGGGTYCEGVTVSLNGTGQPGLGTVTYTWIGPNGVVFTGTAPSAGPFPATLADVTVGDAGVYTLVLSIGDCDSDPASVVVEVNPKPEIINVSGGGTFCANGMTTIQFTIDPNGANSVDWSISGPGLNESGTVTALTPFTFEVTVSPSTAGTYTITASSDAGCEAVPQSVEIIIQDIPQPVLTASPTIICPGDELQLSTDPQQGTNVSYEWFLNGVSLGTTTVPTFNINNPTAGNYTVAIMVDGCTSTSEPVSVTVFPPPVANDDNYTTTVDGPFSENILTNDQTNGEVTITIVSGPTSGTVQLTGGGGFTYTPNGAGTSDQFVYEICLVSCPEQCDQATVTITYDLECIVPNIITPNGDGINDDLRLTCSPPPTSRMRIFNRWGDEISVFEPYVNEAAWDGTYGSDSKPVPAGTYFYLFEPNKDSGDGIQSGYVKVVR